MIVPLLVKLFSLVLPIAEKVAAEEVVEEVVEEISSIEESGLEDEQEA